jgi:hypothetical protein
MVAVGIAARIKYRHDHPRTGAYYRNGVPYAYQLHMDLVWWVLLAVGAYGAFCTFAPLSVGVEPATNAVVCLVVASAIAAMRLIVFLCFRFPLTSWFLVMFISALTGRRRGW